jgi:two-component system response regulator AtoC
LTVLGLSGASRRGRRRRSIRAAGRQQRGRIELADGGTFFLDEVGELAPALQAKLLRVLQEKRFERVGGRQTVEADVRWIAATNRNLAEMVQRGTFRGDPYHRLSLFPVQLPRLRERREDIGPLSDHLLRRIGVTLGRPELRLTDAACGDEREPSPGRGTAPCTAAYILRQAETLRDLVTPRPPGPAAV